MSSNVFLIPCDSSDCERTVLSAIDLTEYPDHPVALADMESVRLWGAGDESDEQTYFEKMESGDLVLFYQDDEYVGTGWIGTTFEDEENWARTTVWDETSFHSLYTIDEFTPVSVSMSAVNTIFDYAENYTPSGLMRVASDRVTNRPEAIKLAVEKYSEKKA